MTCNSITYFKRLFATKSLFKVERRGVFTRPLIIKTNICKLWSVKTAET